MLSIPSEVDARRASLGMGTLAEYLSFFSSRQGEEAAAEIPILDRF